MKGKVLFESALPRTLPFIPDDFEGSASPDATHLKLEYDRLAKEHEQLIGLGATYGDFDTAGKEYYLDQVAQISFRWQELMEDARKIGITPSEGFKGLSEEYLSRAQLNTQSFMALMDGVHEELRQQVAKEAAQGR